MKGEFVQPSTEAEMYVLDEQDLAVLGTELPKLHLSYDRKVSPDGWFQELKSRWVPTVPNSFGLPAGETCPGKTEFCNDCYAVNSERSKGVAEALHSNYELLQKAQGIDEMSLLLDGAVQAFTLVADRKQIPDSKRMFRIHWDGDFFSDDYAKAWAKTIQNFPDLPFWVYTRSFVEPVDVLPDLVGIPNLSLYLSTDRYNVDAAHEMLDRYSDEQLNLAACAEDFIEAESLVRGRRSVKCPENLGRLALMNKRPDQSSRAEGACVSCKLCPDSKADILFVTDKKNALHGRLFYDEVPLELSQRSKPMKTV